MPEFLCRLCVLRASVVRINNSVSSFFRFFHKDFVTVQSLKAKNFLIRPNSLMLKSYQRVSPRITFRD